MDKEKPTLHIVAPDERGPPPDNVVPLPCTTTLPQDPDDVLDAQIGTGLEYVLILGWDKEGNLVACSSDSNMQEAIWIMDKMKHKIYSGGFDAR